MAVSFAGLTEGKGADKMQDFEGAFSGFLDGQGYDEAEEELQSAVREQLYSAMRAAFAAGWTAARGTVENDGK